MKKLLTVGVLVLGVGMLSGCKEPNIKYKGELRPASEVEEIISDELEVENPHLDLEVRITEEVDD